MRIPRIKEVKRCLQDFKGRELQIETLNLDLLSPVLQGICRNEFLLLTSHQFMVFCYITPNGLRQSFLMQSLNLSWWHVPIYKVIEKMCRPLVTTYWNTQGNAPPVCVCGNICSKQCQKGDLGRNSKLFLNFPHYFNRCFSDQTFSNRKFAMAAP